MQEFIILIFEYLNHNPEVSNTENSNYCHKFYFDILLEDKAGFLPDIHWSEINFWLKNYRQQFL